MAGRFAAIDIGTVTCRILVADVDDAGRIHELARDHAITNLGEGVDASGVLSDAAMQRVVDALGGFLRVRDKLIDAEFPFIPTTVVATSASRDASNADEFARRLAELGLKLQVIPGKREAALSFAGASCDFAGEQLLEVDPGGGSTEVVAGQAGSKPLWSHSFNVGCRRITERFLADDPPSPQQIAQARSFVAQTLEPQFAELRETGFKPQRLVAVAGTATSAVSVRDAMVPYDRSRVHKAVVTQSELDSLFARISRMTCEERRHIVGLEPMRAPVITAGFLILQETLRAAQMESFTVSETDILHGIILNAAHILP